MGVLLCEFPDVYCVLYNVIL